jgi:ubiquinone/menaquinone biosynthesis C-methylase UbiE
MPDLNTTLHLDMYQDYRQRNSFLSRLRRAVRELRPSTQLYGLEWGDPEVFRPLKFVRDQYLLPYVNPQHTAVEIGPGGGRWTRYLLGFGQLYVVDYHAELLQELKKHFNRPNMQFVHNHGTDFPGIADDSIDFIFSFGCFVHLDAHLIEQYLKNMRRILKGTGNALIQYSDKTKIIAQTNRGFAENNPDRMRKMVMESGFRILEEDLTTMWHSSIIRFSR